MMTAFVDSPNCASRHGSSAPPSMTTPSPSNGVRPQHLSVSPRAPDRGPSTGDTGGGGMKQCATACWQSPARVRAQTALSGLLVVVDMVSDISVAIAYLNGGHSVWGGLAVAFIALNVLFGWVGIKELIYPRQFASARHDKIKWPMVALSAIGLYPLGSLVRVWDTPDRASRREFLTTKAIEASLESFPQLALQSYVLLYAATTDSAVTGVHFTPNQVALQVLSLCISLVSLCLAATHLRLDSWFGWTAHNFEVDGSHRTVGATVLVAALGLVEVAARVGAFVLFGSAFRGWMLLVTGALALVNGVVLGSTMRGRPAWLQISVFMAIPCTLCAVCDTVRGTRALFLINGVTTLALIVLPVIPATDPVQAGALLGSLPPVHGVCEWQGTVTWCFTEAQWSVLLGLWAVAYCVLAPAVMWRGGMLCGAGAEPDWTLATRRRTESDRCACLCGGGRRGHAGATSRSTWGASGSRSRKVHALPPQPMVPVRVSVREKGADSADGSGASGCDPP